MSQPIMGALNDALADKSVEDKLDFLTAWETLCAQPEGWVIVVGYVASLPEDERRRWLRGKRVEMTRLHMQGLADQRSRGGAYEWRRALHVAVELHRRGLMDIDAGYRDCRSHRRVKTIVREMGRLPFNREDDPGAMMASIYATCRSWPLPDVKDYVREILQTLDGYARTGHEGEP